MEEEQRDKILSSLLLDEAEGISQQVVAWRREFHQFPELAFDERVTAA
ncbi:MAG: Amidohydrolase, partial [Synergistales bacterium 54_24]